MGVASGGGAGSCRMAEEATAVSLGPWRDQLVFGKELGPPREKLLRGGGQVSAHQPGGSRIARGGGGRDFAKSGEILISFKN